MHIYDVFLTITHDDIYHKVAVNHLKEVIIVV